MAAWRLFPFSARLVFSTAVGGEIEGSKKNRQNQLSALKQFFFQKTSKCGCAFENRFSGWSETIFDAIQNCLLVETVLSATQNCLLGETILSAIKNCLPRRQFWVPSKIVCAQNFFLCLCETSSVSHKKIMRAQKKMCARKKKNRWRCRNTTINQK